MTNKIIHGDNLEVLKTYPDNFFHSVVTDPPYGLRFMNKHWDYDVPQVEFWREVLRVLKPGGYVLFHFEFVFKVLNIPRPLSGREKTKGGGAYGLRR
jgi:predicted methyltransferase